LVLRVEGGGRGGNVKPHKDGGARVSVTLHFVYRRGGKKNPPLQSLNHAREEEKIEDVMCAAFG
jgi:hypothetical protein